MREEEPEKSITRKPNGKNDGENDISIKFIEQRKGFFYRDIG